MAKTKISKVATDLNVSLPTVFEYLRKKNINIDESPNTRVEENVVDMLMNAFKSDVDLKKNSSEISSERKETRSRNNERAAAEQPKTAETAETSLGEAGPKPRILGTLERDANGRPIVKKNDAPKAEAPKAPVAPKPEQKPAVAPKAEADRKSVV